MTGLYICVVPDCPFRSDDVEDVADHIIEAHPDVAERVLNE